MSNEDRIQELNRRRELLNKVSPSFCTAKWLQTTLLLQNGYNHSCHHPSPHKIPLDELKDNPAALHNSKFKKQQRAMMLEGKRPAECDYCWRIEDLNKEYFSDRHYKSADTWAWDRMKEIAEADPMADIYPAYLEVSFSNACNFACAYCSPEISSKWMEDIQHDGPYPVQHGAHNLDYLRNTGKMPYLHSEYNPYLEAFWQWFPLALPHLRVLRVTGGEPTMSKDLWRLFDFLKDNPQPNLELAINTNMCTAPALMSRLVGEINATQPYVKKIDIYTSIESTESQAEYARDGLNYTKWCENLDMFLSETETTVAIMTTINILSLPTLINFIELVMRYRIKYNKEFEYNRIPFNINYLRWPLHLQCDLLDKEYRTDIADMIESVSEGWLKYYSIEKYARIYLEEFDQIKRFCSYLRTQPTNKQYRKDFVNFIHAYDKRRNKNFTETYPEYTKIIEEWNA
jgi:pyruvate-formate lyase-activating enzyme